MELVRGKNIVPIPVLKAIPETLEAVVLLKVGDNISTDEILPAGARVLPYRSNIPEISNFAFDAIDPSYSNNARKAPTKDGHVIVGGFNYGQGSSREHAALAPRYLELWLVIAKSFARIHWQNLVNFGVLPLVLDGESQYERINKGDILRIANVHERLRDGAEIVVEIASRGETIKARHNYLPDRSMYYWQAGSSIGSSRLSGRSSTLQTAKRSCLQRLASTALEVQQNRHGPGWDARSVTLALGRIRAERRLALSACAKPGSQRAAVRPDRRCFVTSVEPTEARIHQGARRHSCNRCRAALVAANLITNQAYRTSASSCDLAILCSLPVAPSNAQLVADFEATVAQTTRTGTA